MDAPNLTVERVAELVEKVFHLQSMNMNLALYDGDTFDWRDQEDVLALLRAEAARLASPASPDIRPAGYNGPLSGPEVITGQPAAPEEEPGYPKYVTVICPKCSCFQGAAIHFYKGDPFPTYLYACAQCGVSVGESEWIEEKPAAPAKPRVSREWLRWQAGEIWSAKTIDDAMDTLADTIKGFGVEVEGEE